MWLKPLASSLHVVIYMEYLTVRLNQNKSMGTFPVSFVFNLLGAQSGALPLDLT